MTRLDETMTWLGLKDSLKMDEELLTLKKEKKLQREFHF